MNIDSSSRSRSGLAPVSRSVKICCRSISWAVVIACSNARVELVAPSKKHAVTVFRSVATRRSSRSGSGSYTILMDVTRGGSGCEFAGLLAVVDVRSLIRTFDMIGELRLDRRCLEYFQPPSEPDLCIEVATMRRVGTPRTWPGGSYGPHRSVVQVSVSAVE